MDFSDPIDLIPLKANPCKHLVVLQDDSYYCVSRLSDADDVDDETSTSKWSIVRRRVDFRDGVILNKVFINSDLLYDISPPGVGGGSNPLLYANVLLGACKPSPTRVGETCELVVPVPSWFSGAVVDQTDLVEEVTYESFQTP